MEEAVGDKAAIWVYNVRIEHTRAFYEKIEDERGRKMDQKKCEEGFPQSAGNGKKRKRGKAPQKRGQALYALLALTSGMASGLVIVTSKEAKHAMGESYGSFLFVIATSLVFLYVTHFLHIILHEAGHLAFGLMTGYRFLSFRIGSFLWRKEDGRFVVRRMKIPGTGGQCLMSPPKLLNGKAPFVLYNLGGSLANLIFAFLSAAVSVGLDAAGVWHAPLFFRILSVDGLGLALMNGVPLRLAAVNNDGYNAISLGKSPVALRSFWVQLKANEQIAKGVRLKDMPNEWFFMPSDEELSNSMSVVMAALYEERLMDGLHFLEAERLIDRLLSIDTAMSGLHKSLLCCDRICCALLLGQEEEAIAKWQTDGQKNFMRQMGKLLGVLRTEYICALLWEKDAKKAEEVRERFEASAKRHPYPGDLESERELMRIADEKVKGIASLPIAKAASSSL